MTRTALLVLGVLSVSQLAAGEMPLGEGGSVTRVNVSLDAERHNAHMAWIPARGRKFELRVVPTFDAWNDIESWVVELSSADAGSQNGRNLLAPPGNWHGLQLFDVLPLDVEGAGIYPARRVIERAQLTCTIEVVGGTAKPSRATPGARIFESLTLAIEIAIKADEPTSRSDAERRQR